MQRRQRAAGDGLGRRKDDILEEIVNEADDAL
jgi:hypothetical protein